MRSVGPIVEQGKKVRHVLGGEGVIAELGKDERSQMARIVWSEACARYLNDWCHTYNLIVDGNS